MRGRLPEGRDFVNLLVCGVGGQGVLLFSDLLGSVALSAGLDVKKSEVHGMAQRGGSVSTHVRYGRKVYSPLIEEGTADMVVAFERLEALRYSHFLARNGRLVYDEYRLDPLPVQSGLVERPDDASLDERIAARVRRHVAVSAFATAVRLGNARVQNVVMLGAVSRFLEFPVESFRDAIRQTVKPALVELNIAALAEGRRLTGK
ncbi:MAG: indolepyruvate oxidoreductase subunit beta [bacterium]